MAKALLGYKTGFDPRETSRTGAENRLLRQRVADLEATVLRLSKENDALVESLREQDLDRTFEPA